MKRKLLTLSLALTLATLNTFGQFSITSQKDAALIKESKLLVVLEEPDPKTLKKLAKNGQSEVDNYKLQIEGRNKALGEAAEGYWSFSSEVKVLKESEVYDFLDGNDGYVTLQYGEYLDYYRMTSPFTNTGKMAGWTRDSQTGLPTYLAPTRYSVLANEITTLEILDKKSLIKVYLPNLSPSKTDVVYGLKEIQYILTYLSEGNKFIGILKQIKANNAELDKVTLLIDKDDVDEDLTEDLIKEIYPHPFMISDYETIEKAILEENPQYAYVTIVSVPGGKGNVNAHTILGAKDGKIYRYLMPKVAFGIKGTSAIQYNTRIREKQVKKYIVE